MKQLFFLFILFFMCHAPFVYGLWRGPIEIVYVHWGNGPGEIGIVRGDGDLFPQSFGITQNGKVIIADPYNEVLHIFSQNGSLYKEIKPPIKHEGWPYSVLVNGECCTVGYVEYTYTFDVKTGNIIGVADKIGGANYLSDDCKKIFVYKTNGMAAYSLAGQLLKTYDTRPLELGLIKEQSIGNNKYKVTVTYSDKTWEMIQDYGACPDYKRDACGNLYCGTSRFSSIGENLAPEEIIPQNKFEETPISTSRDIGTRIKWIEEYGSPVLAPNGDVYTWKRTPDKYSIIKWVWVDGPECPQYLNVKSTMNSLKFTWQKPTKDADKITGYQLLQSYNICGPFRQTALLKKDQLSYEDRDIKKGETYYYIVKAIRGKDYSGNSNKVCGQLE